MIKIDVTGFYYRGQVDPEGVKTVADAMNKADGVPSPINGGILTVSSDANGFVNSISVDYPTDSTPESGQGLGPRPTGSYSFDDDPMGQGNLIPGAGSIDGQLAWQYYVERDGVVLNRNRRITPYTDSDSEFGDLQSGDKIIWRLVAIFGLREAMQQQRQTLENFVAQNGAISMKSAVRLVRGG